MQENNRKNKGITLISLTVTIIILIILAGVSLNLTLGESGIITIAKQAKENIEIAQIEEETKLNELYTQIGIEGDITGNLNYDAIEKLQEFKRAIANAITNQGVPTSEDATKEEMVENINKIKGKTEFNVSQLLYNSIKKNETMEFKEITGGSFTQSVRAENGSSMYAQSQATTAKTDKIKLIDIENDTITALYTCEFKLDVSFSEAGYSYTVTPNCTITLYDANDNRIDSKSFTWNAQPNTITFSLLDYKIETNEIYYTVSMRAYASASPYTGLKNVVNGTYIFDKDVNLQYISNK